MKDKRRAVVHKLLEMRDQTSRAEDTPPFFAASMHDFAVLVFLNQYISQR